MLNEDGKNRSSYFKDMCLKCKQACNHKETLQMSVQVKKENFLINCLKERESKMKNESEKWRAKLVESQR